MDKEEMEKEDYKKEMIKAEKGLFIGFILIPMILALLIISLIGIYILNITTFELIFTIGFWIALVIIVRRLDNSQIRRKYFEFELQLVDGDREFGLTITPEKKKKKNKRGLKESENN